MGIGRYTYHLIENLARVDHANQYEILIPEGTHDFQLWPNVRYRLIRLPVFKRRVWEQLAPLVVGNYDLLHFPYDSCIGMKRGKFVVTLHDAKPILYPHTSNRWSTIRTIGIDHNDLVSPIHTHEARLNVTFFIFRNRHG